MAAPTHAISHEVSSLTSAAPVTLVFGFQDATVAWLVHHLREAGVAAVPVPADLPTAAAAAVVAAADSCVHVFSAGQGVDGTYLEYWQMCAEAGKVRYVGVCDLTPMSLDVNEAAAIAGRVLEEDVLVTTLPLLDDDESVIGVLDVVTGEQWFPDGDIQDPREDFSEAVEAETNTWFDEAEALALSPGDALLSGQLAAAITFSTTTRAGVGWLAARMPGRQIPAAATVLSTDGERAVVTAGPDGLGVGPALSLVGTDTAAVRLKALASVTEPGLVARLAPGQVAAADIEPQVPTGALLLPQS